MKYTAFTWNLFVIIFHTCRNSNQEPELIVQVNQSIFFNNISISQSTTIHPYDRFSNTITPPPKFCSISSKFTLFATPARVPWHLLSKCAKHDFSSQQPSRNLPLLLPPPPPYEKDRRSQTTSSSSRARKWENEGSGKGATRAREKLCWHAPSSKTLVTRTSSNEFVRAREKHRVLIDILRVDEFYVSWTDGLLLLLRFPTFLAVFVRAGEGRQFWIAKDVCVCVCVRGGSFVRVRVIWWEKFLMAYGDFFFTFEMFTCECCWWPIYQVWFVFK